MNLFKKPRLLLIALFFLSLSANAQSQSNFIAKSGKLSETELKRWSHLDLVKDSIPGMSVDRVYAELIKNKKGQKVVGGVVDSGGVA